eukprot:365228-Chlamydomonas_euryale.AAC.8
MRLNTPAKDNQQAKYDWSICGVYAHKVAGLVLPYTGAKMAQARAFCIQSGHATGRAGAAGAVRDDARSGLRAHPRRSQIKCHSVNSATVR